MKALLLILAALAILSGCGILPIPWYVSATSTATDVALHQKTGKTSTELLIGVVTKMDCQWSRVLDLGTKLCMTQSEHLDYLLAKNCDTYKWNILGLPECRTLAYSGAH